MALRVTNHIIMNNANTNINATKVAVDKRNTQMTTQKKINRPSEDPVVAVRGLRLQTSLNKIDQYYEKNIPDAEKWMDVTSSALSNMEKLMVDMRTLANAIPSSPSLRPCSSRFTMKATPTMPAGLSLRASVRTRT